MQTYSGSCLCGAASFRLEGEFTGFYLCHCRYCQKDTGSAHAANLFAPSANLVWLSGEDAITTFTLAGTRHSKSFCQQCGSALPGRQEAAAAIVVPAGCLDNDPDIQPTAHLFTDSKAAWETGLENVPAFRRLPE